MWNRAGPLQGPTQAQKWRGPGPAQSKGQHTEIMCPAQKWPVSDTVSCPCGTDEPLSVAAPRSKGRPAAGSNPGAKVARTRPIAK